MIFIAPALTLIAGFLLGAVVALFWRFEQDAALEAKLKPDTSREPRGPAPPVKMTTGMDYRDKHVHPHSHLGAECPWCRCGHVRPFHHVTPLFNSCAAEPPYIIGYCSEKCGYSPLTATPWFHPEGGLLLAPRSQAELDDMIKLMPRWEPTSENPRPHT